MLLRNVDSYDTKFAIHHVLFSFILLLFCCTISVSKTRPFRCPNCSHLGVMFAREECVFFFSTKLIDLDDLICRDDRSIISIRYSILFCNDAFFTTSFSFRCRHARVSMLFTDIEAEERRCRCIGVFFMNVLLEIMLTYRSFCQQ